MEALRMLLDEFLDDLTAQGKSPDTIQSFKGKILEFARFVGEVDVAEISAEDIERWRRTLRRRMKENSTTAYLVAVRCFFNWLERKKIYEANPFHIVKIKRAQDPPREYLEPPEINTLFAHCRSPKETLIIALGVFAGLRAIEMFRLRVEDVQPDKLTVHGKGDKIEDVPINPSLRSLLTVYIVGGFAGPETLLGFSRGHIRNVVINVGKRAGMKVSAHILRHTFGTHTIRVSDLETARVLLRHSDIQTTAIYLHTDARRLRNTVADLPYTLN